LLFSLDAPKSIGLVVKAGYDFPASLEQIFTQWNLDLCIIRENDRPSSRGRILYAEDASNRQYQRLTPPMPSTVEDIDAARMIGATCFHFFDNPAVVREQVTHITALSVRQGFRVRPWYVWEPQAKSCSPETFAYHKDIVERVDIFSPNHAELASFFTKSTSSAVVFDKETIEQQARAFLPSTIRQPLCILIRCAEHGCFVLSATPWGEEKTAWMPPYHLSGSESVVDPTGAGNAFLGGAAMGYLEHGDFFKAAAYGSVAASFAVETVGLPDIQKCGVKARLEDYVSRLGMALG
jgi:sugar/nucleoside kinase (ribokinase family)